MKSFVRWIALGVLVFVAMGSRTQAQGLKKVEPCALLSKAEIREVVGQDVSDGQLNKTNPTLCEHKIGSGGLLNIFVRQNNPADNPDKMMAELNKRKIQCTEIKGIGDRAFFAAQGYGMIQLNAFKGKSYVVLTILIPGVAEAKTKTMAEKLVQKALAKL